MTLNDSINVEFSGGMENLFGTTKLSLSLGQIKQSNTTELRSRDVSSGNACSKDACTNDVAAEDVCDYALDSDTLNSQCVQSVMIADLIHHLAKYHLKDRPELFITDATSIASSIPSSNGTNSLFLRPGILCLLNEADWELEAKEQTILNAGDSVVFISTLHGG